MEVKRAYFAGLLFIAILAAGCNTTEAPVEMGYNYYPLDLGRYYIYDVDSIHISCLDDINDTFHYQVKEYYDTLFTDASGEPAVRLERSRRNNSTDAWTITDIWYVKQTASRLEKTEENLKFIKMTYPVDQGYTWNGNAYNFLGEQDYFNGTPDVAFNKDGVIFDSTLTVYQQIDTNMIEYYYYAETYRRNIGMVHKVKINIESAIVNDSFDPGNPPSNSCWADIPAGVYWYQVYIQNRIKLGSITKYKLVEHGVE